MSKNKNKIPADDINPLDTAKESEDTITPDTSSEENTTDDTTIKDMDGDLASSATENPDTQNEPGSDIIDEISDTDAADKKKKRKKIIIRSLRILFTIGFFVFLSLFLNEVLVQPYKFKKATEKARELYNYVETAPTKKPDNTTENDTSDEPNDDSNPDESDTDMEPTAAPDPNRDEKRRLLKFRKLLEINEDVKGWIRIDNTNGENDTKIDYVVMQSGASDPEYYLSRAWDTKEYLKAGSLFLDYTSSVEKNSPNLIIHGHNMTSSDDMFHYLVQYQKLNFLKEHPIISFDTIYEEGLWKVFSVYITPGNNDRDDFFPFNTSNFNSSRDFMSYLYQIRIRSLFNIDEVDINENDQILTLSTCSYELSNYRTIVVARKVREGEEPAIDVDKIEKNKNALYPPSFNKHYGKQQPDIPSFEAALEDGLIPWYNPINH